MNKDPNPMITDNPNCSEYVVEENVPLFHLMVQFSKTVTKNRRWNFTTTEEKRRKTTTKMYPKMNAPVPHRLAGLDRMVKRYAITIPFKEPMKMKTALMLLPNVILARSTAMITAKFGATIFDDIAPIKTRIEHNVEPFFGKKHILKR